MKGDTILDTSPPPAKRRCARGKVAITATLISLAWLSYQQCYARFDPERPAVYARPNLAPQKFDWFELQPSENITNTWTGCYDGQKCARLTLPLDYQQPDGPKTHIALRMIPATDRENYKGPILLNPGGPGGSGTIFIDRYGASIAKIVGPEFDIVGFDPRGIGATTPQAQCFDTESQYKQWALNGETLLVNLNDTTASIWQSRERLVSERCLATIGGNGKTDLNGTAQEWGAGRFMNTPFVATDMLRIAEQFGQEKVQYWGFSYGTVLGQYFAAMYPDRVGRLVIDGVLDAENYSRGLWDDNLVDMDKVINSFYTYCHQAGPKKCALYESTAEGVERRVHHLLDTIEAAPLPIPFGRSGPGLVTRGVLQYSIFRAAYKPATDYKALAERLHAVETNNQTALHDAFANILSVDCGCGPQVQPWEAHTEALYPIAYGDSGPLQQQPGEIEAHFDRLYSQSSLTAPFWVGIRMGAWEWKIQSKWRYTGPFAGNTSHPILIAQPTYDPVCPLAHAKKVQKRYSGAGFLEQRSFGHCTLSAPSVCSAKHIRAYFVNGTLPKEGTVCEPDELPFIGEVNPKIQSIEDHDLLQALKELEHATPFLGLR